MQDMQNFFFVCLINNLIFLFVFYLVVFCFAILRGTYSLYLQHGASPYHMHVSSRMHALYSSYNPVSRQDSELQSLSSDARTEVDNVSLNDGSM